MARIKPVEIQSKEECVELINDVARLEMQRRKQELELKRKIQALQDEFGPGVVALQELIEGKVARISEYLDAHADAMFKKGTKSGETALAEFGFRIGNPTLGTAKKWKWATSFTESTWTKRSLSFRPSPLLTIISFPKASTG